MLPLRTHKSGRFLAFCRSSCAIIIVSSMLILVLMVQLLIAQSTSQQYRERRQTKTDAAFPTTDSEKAPQIGPEDRKVFNQIEHLIDKVVNNLERSRLLCLWADLQARYGDRTASRASFQNSVKALEKAQLPEEEDKVKEYKHLAHAMINSDFCEDALQIARTINRSRDDNIKKWGDAIVLVVAYELVKKGQRKEALALRDKLVIKDYDNWLRVAIALAEADIGDIHGALRTVYSISDEDCKVTALVGMNTTYGKGIAQIQADQGDLSGSLTTIEKAVAFIQKCEEPTRSIYYAKVAIAQAQIGDYRNALKSIKSIQSASFQDYAFHEIAVARAASGDWIDVSKLLPKIHEASVKAFVLKEIAVAQNKSGARAASQETLKRSLQLAIQLMRESQSSGNENRIANARALLADIALAQAKIGSFRKSILTVSSYTQGFPAVLRDIATTQVSLGDADGALSTIDLIKDAYEKGRAVWLISSQQAKLGDERPILSWVDNKQLSPYYKAHALMGLLYGRKIIRNTIGAVPLDKRE